MFELQKKSATPNQNPKMPTLASECYRYVALPLQESSCMHNFVWRVVHSNHWRVITKSLCRSQSCWQVHFSHWKLSKKDLTQQETLVNAGGWWIVHISATIYRIRSSHILWWERLHLIADRYTRWKALINSWPAARSRCARLGEPEWKYVCVETPRNNSMHRPLTL